MSEEREISTIEQAIELADEWAAAYKELLREHRRLELRCDHAEAELDYYVFLRRYLDPFLPPAMQDPVARAAEPELYRAIAEHLQEPQRHSPFDEPELAEADPFA